VGRILTRGEDLMDAEEGLYRRWPAVPFGTRPGRGPPGLLLPGQHADHPGREVLTRHAGPGVAHDLGQGGFRAYHHRSPAGQRLERGKPEGLRRARRDGHVGAGQQRG
jgi:hypothetical protein